jgi:UDP-galactopyranose mutase
VALLLFARNESTRFISPTKTPEYLAAGKPVVSTSIQDVVHPYGERNLVNIADRPEDFVRAIEKVLALGDDEQRQWRSDVEEFLRNISWDDTWSEMSRLIDNVVIPRKAAVMARGQRMVKMQAVGLSGTS